MDSIESEHKHNTAVFWNVYYKLKCTEGCINVEIFKFCSAPMFCRQMLQITHSFHSCR